MKFVATWLGGPDDVPIESAAALLDQAMTLPAWDSILVYPESGGPDFPRLMFDWHDKAGFVLHCFEDGDSWGFFLAESLEWGPCEVRVELGGQSTEDWPRQLFVSHALALEALEAFLATGKQRPDLNWVRTDQIPRKILRES